MAVIPYAWITLAQAKTHLGISSTGYDSELELLIDGVTDYIEKQLGGRRLKLSTGTVTEIYDGGDGYQTRLILKKWPVRTADITSIKYNIGDFETPSWSTFQATSWTIYEESGEIKMPAGLPIGSNNIQVIYKGGYNTSTGTTGGTGLATGNFGFPNDLKILAIKLVARIFNKRKSDGVLNEKIGSAGLTWDKKLDIEDERTLNSYKRITIA